MTIDFFDTEQIEPMHAAFAADDATFDRILEQSLFQRIAYGNQPNDPANRRVDHPLSDRGMYFRMPDGHLFEVMASHSEGNRA